MPSWMFERVAVSEGLKANVSTLQPKLCFMCWVNQKVGNLDALEQCYSTNFNEGPVGEFRYFQRSNRIFDLQ